MSEQVVEEPGLPIEIDDAETIVRAVVSPAHYRKGKLATAVFRPRVGESSISVMRQLMGDDFCKAKGVEIGRRSNSQTYVGLLTIKVDAIRATGSTVTDSRREWLGHADLDHGFSVPADDPPTSQVFIQMTERCNELKNASVFHPDPAADQEGWSGPPLKME